MCVEETVMMIHFSGNLKNIGVKKLTENLDLFLSTVSDEPKISGAMPLNCEKVNSVIALYIRKKVARGGWIFFILLAISCCLF